MKRFVLPAHQHLLVYRTSCPDMTFVLLVYHSSWTRCRNIQPMDRQPPGRPRSIIQGEVKQPVATRAVVRE